MKSIYLDYNATTPCAASVLEAMAPYWLERYGNPSSDHSLGRVAHAAMEDSRAHLAELLSCDPDEIVFTSGGTESNNLAILGCLLALRDRLGTRRHLVISAIEHPAVSEPARFLQQLGHEVTVCGCDENGVVHLDQLTKALRPDTVLVSIMHANNEVGSVQPLGEISRLCRASGVLLHTDAAQTIGKLRTKVDDLGVDLLSIAGHKFYAPKGIGALFIRNGVAVDRILHGAGQESGLRPGTECVPLIVGLGAAARLAAAVDVQQREQQATLRDRLWELLQEGIGEGLHCHAAQADRLPNTLSVSFPRVSGRELLADVPEIMASVGSACHGPHGGISTTLQAMNVDPVRARGTIRLSVGWTSSLEEIERAAGLLVDAWTRRISTNRRRRD
jgi:cysteine desulfurase